mgnify:CR=1 FL=1
MNWENVRQRIDDIIQTDVLINEEYDFLATHIPFKKLSVQKSGRTDARAETLSETEVFDNLVINPDNNHRFIIIRGDNGAGKSHLIRWLRAKIGSTNQFENEHVVFIRRIENNLQGAMKQLLHQGVVTDPEQRQRFEKFVDASQAKSKQELKLNIFFGFVAKVESDENDLYFSKGRRRRIASLLKNEYVQEYLLAADGPIERFYDSIFSPHTKGAKGEIMFLAEDFIGMDELFGKITDNRIKTEFRKVTQQEDALKLAEYLNGFSESVVQSLANVVQGDMASLIRDLRVDLKKRGKSLIILIEDLTTFTGIQAELVNVLSTAHGGEYSELCRVTSIIGITNSYYESYFLGNFQDRVTHQITINQESYNDSDTLAKMAAKYINAAYLSVEEVKDWHENGARPELLPYRTWEPKNFLWESVEVDGRSFSIFPFTKNALNRLFDNLPEGAKTPRFFLRDIIRSHLTSWIDFQLKLGSFPDMNQLHSYVTNLPLAYDSRILNSSFSESEQKRLRYLFSIWGKNNIEMVDREGSSLIGGLPIAFFDLLGFVDIQRLGIEVIKDIETDLPDDDRQVEEELEPENIEKISPQEDLMQKTLKDIRSWRQNKTNLAFSANLRDIIKDFLVDAINWQSLGVPAYLVSNELRTSRSIYIEGQSQRGLSKEQALIVITREEGYELLIALCHWRYPERTWKFEEGPYMQYQAISWLEKVKPMLVNKLMGLPTHTPEEIMEWSLSLEYLRLAINGHLNSQMTDKNLLYKIFNKEVTKSTSRCVRTDQLWNRLQERTNISKKNVYETNLKLLEEFYQPIMGSILQSSKAIFYDREKIDSVFAKIDFHNMDTSELLNRDTSDLSGPRKETIEELKIVLPQLINAIDQDVKEYKDVISKLRDKLGNELNEQTWSNASKAGRDFLNTISFYGLYVDNKYQILLSKMNNDRKELSRIASFTNELDDATFHEKVLFFSENPNKSLVEVFSLLESIEKEALEKKKTEQNKLEQLKKEQEARIPDLPIIKKNSELILSLIEKVGGE